MLKILALPCGLLLPTYAFSQEAIQRRQHDFNVLAKILPPTNKKMTGRINALDATWEEWLKRTWELPPDFDSMPSMPDVPGPLQGVTTPTQWGEKRKWIRSQFEHWVFGRMPPKPNNLRAMVTGTHREGDITVREVWLEFGPGHKATLRVQLMIPPVKGPFPVFMTNHPRTRPWVATDVRRGYIGYIYYVKRSLNGRRGSTAIPSQIGSG